MVGKGVEMDFQTLCKGVELYKTKGFNESYKKFVLDQRKTWEDIDRISESEIKEIIIKFLNSWGAIRFPYKNAIELRKALKELNKHFHVLLKRDLIGLEFDEEIEVGGQKKKISKIIREIYERLDKVDGIGATAASKIMHGIIPQLFMMWDGNIREDGYADNATGYLKFLRESQRILKNLTEKYGKSAEEVSREASPEMNRPLTKLLDEHNYMKFTEGEDLPDPAEDC